MVTPVIGIGGDAPKGVATNQAGTKARKITQPKPARKRGTAGLSHKREIRIMLSAKVPYPRMGDRRALIAPRPKGAKPYPKNDPRNSRTFAVVEYAGNVCVFVHGGTDDYRKALEMGALAAHKVEKFLTRGIRSHVARNGSAVGERVVVKVVDRTGLFKRASAPSSTRKKGKAKKISLVRAEPRRTLTKAEQIQRDHARDIERYGYCTVCAPPEPGGRRKGKNERCDDNTELSPGVATLREQLAAEKEAERATEYDVMAEMRRQMKALTQGE